MFEDAPLTELMEAVVREFNSTETKDGKPYSPDDALRDALLFILKHPELDHARRRLFEAAVICFGSDSFLDICAVGSSRSRTVIAADGTRHPYGVNPDYFMGTIRPMLRELLKHTEPWSTNWAGLEEIYNRRRSSQALAQAQ